MGPTRFQIDRVRFDSSAPRQMMIDWSHVAQTVDGLLFLSISIACIGAGARLVQFLKGES